MHELTKDGPLRNRSHERLFARARGGSYIDVLFLPAADRVMVSQSRENGEGR